MHEANQSKYKLSPKLHGRVHVGEQSVAKTSKKGYEDVKLIKKTQNVMQHSHLLCLHSSCVLLAKTQFCDGNIIQNNVEVTSSLYQLTPHQQGNLKHTVFMTPQQLTSWSHLKYII
jgi:hypothetical protein